MSWLIPCAAGVATGVLSAFGVGGGSLLLIYLTVFAGVSQQAAQGINLLYFLPAAAAALPSHKKNGLLDRQTIRPAVLTGLVTAAGAAWLSNGLDTRVLRKLFGVFLLYVGVTQLLKKDDTEGKEHPAGPDQADGM